MGGGAGGGSCKIYTIGVIRPTINSKKSDKTILVVALYKPSASLSNNLVANCNRVKTVIMEHSTENVIVICSSSKAALVIERKNSQSHFKMSYCSTSNTLVSFVKIKEGEP